MPNPAAGVPQSSTTPKSGSGPPKKESILELAKLMDAVVKVKCLGGRELQGTLRGYDDLVNLVLDECDEFIRGNICHDVECNVAD